MSNSSAKLGKVPATVNIAEMTPPNPHLSNLKYRPDIDGLRAVAVLSVVAFHAFPGWLTGGFIGVDIFFVISGFLISTIIFENLERGAFSFSDFYARRIRRIFPALLLVLLASYAFGWYALLSDEYKQLGKHMSAGAGFVSNFILLSEAGYFDNSAETKPLLHLWSLGIEEQFYIVWPFVLWLAWKKKVNLVALTILVAVISFYLNLKGVSSDRVATFYSPQTRFWELLSGSLLAWFLLYRKEAFSNFKLRIDGWLVNCKYREAPEIGGVNLSDLISFVGSLLLIFGFWRITKDASFPGWWAVVPVLGAVLIILAGPKAWFNRVVLANKVAVWFGLISFPLYLWHWPLLSFARIVEGEVPSQSLRVAVVVLSVVLAWLTYKFVERPLRFGQRGKTVVAVLVFLLISIGCVGFVTYQRDGFGFRMKDREEFVSHFENSHPNWMYFNNNNFYSEWRSECGFFDSKKYLKDGKLQGGVTDSKPVEELAPSCFKRDVQFEKSVLVWGDSHAQALSPGLRMFMPSKWQILQIASSGCSPNPNVYSASTDSQCKQSNYFAIKTIKEVVPDVVVVAQANGHSIQAMNDISAKLKQVGVKRIVFLGPAPQWKSELPKIIARQLWQTKPNRTFVGVNREVLDANGVLLREFPSGGNARFVDVIGLFCDADGCLTRTGDDIKESIVTWDYGHLTLSGSRYLAKNLLVRHITED
jgi:peptidoglycan/LPS O-acetylase OafA/YrhL